MKEHWHPSIKIVDIAEKTLLFTQRNTIKIKLISNLLTKFSHSLVNLERPFLKLVGFVFLLRLLMVVYLTFFDALNKKLSSGIQV